MPTVSAFPTSNAIVVTGWNSPTSAYLDDALFASCSPAKGAYVSTDFGGFGFDGLIPAEATINSVTLDVVAKGNSATALTVLYQPVIGGSVFGTEKTFLTSPMNTDVPNSETWTGILRDDLLNANFKARVRATRSGNTVYTVQLDFVRVTVDYSIPQSANTSVDSVSGEGSVVSAAAQGAAFTSIDGVSGTGAIGDVRAEVLLPPVPASTTISVVSGYSSISAVTAAGKSLASIQTQTSVGSVSSATSRGAARVSLQSVAGQSTIQPVYAEVVIPIIPASTGISVVGGVGNISSAVAHGKSAASITSIQAAGTIVAVAPRGAARTSLTGVSGQSSIQDVHVSAINIVRTSVNSVSGYASVQNVEVRANASTSLVTVQGTGNVSALAASGKSSAGIQIVYASSVLQPVTAGGRARSSIGIVSTEAIVAELRAYGYSRTYLESVGGVGILFPAGPIVLEPPERIGGSCLYNEELKAVRVGGSEYQPRAVGVGGHGPEPVTGAGGNVPPKGVRVYGQIV